MGNECGVTAIVKEVRRDKITVEAQPESVCDCCGVKMLCGAARERIYTISISAQYVCKQGDRICLIMHAKFIIAEACIDINS